MTREQAVELLHKNMSNENLRRHCYAVEVVMRALARHFHEDEEIWGLAGLLHDADYELTKDTPREHTHKTVEWLKKYDGVERISQAILTHGHGYVEGNPQPKTKMEWSLFTCDELTGLIVAVALVKGKKLESVTAESVLKKFPEKAFAAGVHREQIALCQEKLDTPLPEFIALALTAMQNSHEVLGL